MILKLQIRRTHEILMKLGSKEEKGSNTHNQSMMRREPCFGKQEELIVFASKAIFSLSREPRRKDLYLTWIKNFLF